MENTVPKPERLRDEAVALWIEVFGEPPKEDLDGSQMLKVLLQNLETKNYTRLNAADNARNLAWPRKRSPA
jgi:hypothetical protein